MSLSPTKLPRRIGHSAIDGAGAISVGDPECVGQWLSQISLKRTTVPPITSGINQSLKSPSLAAYFFAEKTIPTSGRFGVSVKYPDACLSDTYAKWRQGFFMASHRNP
jgi:hypothetical protein